MNKDEIINQLKTHHQEFADYIQSLSTADFLHQKEDKWTAGQQLDHIVRSVSPVTLAFSLPRMVPRMMFGKANRPSRDYQTLVDKYKIQLGKGGKASGRFVPKPVEMREKYLLPKQVMHYVDKLNKQIGKCSEEELDFYILPHPLLGKLAFREMLYFTDYHVQHHHEITKRNLNQL